MPDNVMTNLDGPKPSDLACNGSGLKVIILIVRPAPREIGWSPAGAF